MHGRILCSKAIGSVFELLKAIGPLTDSLTHVGHVEDAFDLVLPSMPWYGFSGKPTGTDWNPDRIARPWAEPMRRLGYTRDGAPSTGGADGLEV